MAELPDLDRPDIFCWGLTFTQFGQLGLCAVADALPLVALWFAHVHAAMVVVPVVGVVAVVTYVEFLAIKTKRGGEPLVVVARRAWRFYQSPRRYVLDPREIPATTWVARSPLRRFVRTKPRRGLEGEAVSPLELPWSGYTEDGDAMVGETLARTLVVSGLDVALASNVERDILGRTWARMLDARDVGIMVLARAERLDLSRRIDEVEGRAFVGGLGQLADAHGAQLRGYHGGTQKRLLVVLTGPDARALDAAETDFTEDLTAMRLRAERVVGDSRPWWSGEGADHLLPTVLGMTESPDRLETV